jgi:CHASE2 domain-containing sensor protein
VQWRSASLCAAATAMLGLLCLAILPIRFWCERLSYDLPFYFARPESVDEVVVIQRDEKSYRDLHQEYGKLWDRSLYVPVLDRLAAEHARLAVFDISLADPGSPKTNALLAQAIRKNGHVVLGVDYRLLRGKLSGIEKLYPRDEFKEAAAALGFVTVRKDNADGVVREIDPGIEDLPTLAWAAAIQAGLPATEVASRLEKVRWLNYPSSLDQIRRISFSDALGQQPGFYSNKCIFLGGSPQVKLETEQTDEFATPSQRWSGAPQPGVVLQAAAFLNLLHGNWLEQMPALLEMVLLLSLGAVGALIIARFRPWIGAVAAVIIIATVFTGACALVFFAHRWCAWMVVAGAEIPFAFAWTVVAQSRQLAREKALVSSELALERRAVERLLPQTESEAATIRSDVGEAGEGAVAAQGPGGTAVLPPPVTGLAAEVRGNEWAPPSVPDHSLVRCIGEGGYGQVWLARDVIGTHHAVKFVYRKTFDSAAPFDREFKGIHHFTPISRMHAGFVNILHVGRNDRAGYFFYIMELADDETTGQQINPDTYAAKTLSRWLRKEGRLPAATCVKLGLELSSALEFLHQRRLIHRDIKPSNVLFVHGQAKFADVGLVTQIDTRRADATYIGTEGYIAPEGPGSAAADVYSLGKVLYEAAMGLDRMRFPDLPTAVVEQSDPMLMQLNEIILKSCEFNPRERFQSAQQLNDALRALSV